MAKESQISARIDEDDPETILASLSAKAPDIEVRDCIRCYKHKNTYKNNKSSMTAVYKAILERTALYLKVEIADMKKNDIIHEIICRIQNLLPDTCRVCEQSYTTNIDDPAYLPCEVCGQEVHRECFEKLIGSPTASLPPGINPHNIPGIHFFCKECEDEISSLLDNKKVFQSSKKDKMGATSNGKSKKPKETRAQEESQNPGQISSDGANTHVFTPQASGGDLSTQSPICDVPTSIGNEIVVEEIIHSSQIAGSSSTPDEPTSIEATSTNDGSSSAKAIQIPPKSLQDNTTVVLQDNITVVPEITVNTAPKKVSEKTCTYYKQNTCRYGVKGTGCPFKHPERCQKLLKHGTAQPTGCNKGKKCELFHPKICPTSITKRECFDPRCHLSHIKGTNRNPKLQTKKPSGSTPSATLLMESVPSNPVTVTETGKGTSTGSANIPTISKDNASAGTGQESVQSNSSFLEFARLIKEELMQAIDLKIALAISNIQIPQPQYKAVPAQPQAQTNPVYPNLLHQLSQMGYLAPQIPYYYPPSPPMPHPQMPHQAAQAQTTC